MIAYIIGRIEEVFEGGLIIESQDMGYLVTVSNATCSRVGKGQEIKLFTKLMVKENDMGLVGFLSREEQRMFEMLTAVNGVGTKAALSILSSADASKITLAILTEDADELSRAQGIGKKLAGRIVLELKDKLKGSESYYEVAAQQNIGTMQVASAKQDAIDALLALGYSKSDALRAAMEVALEGMDAEQIIRLALRKLASS